MYLSLGCRWLFVNGNTTEEHTRPSFLLSLKYPFERQLLSVPKFCLTDSPAVFWSRGVVGVRAPVLTALFFYYSSYFLGGTKKCQGKM